MTAQSSEILVVENRPYALRSLPLDPYLKSRDSTLPELTWITTTSNYRGYVGCWEVFNDNLYLIGIFDYENRPFDKSLIDWKLPIKAHWFSGRLDIDHGDMLSYTHTGWSSVRAKRTRLYFKNGRFERRVRVDRAKYLKKEYDLTPDQEIEYRQWQAENGHRIMGGLTKAGFDAIGREPFPEERVWSMTGEDDADLEYYLPMIDLCTRPQVGSKEVASASAWGAVAS